MSEERAANAVDRRLGQRVRSRRLEIGMSQEALADLLGVTFQQVQKYEKGVNRIAASRLFAIAAALDMPIERFFEGLAAGPRGAGEETSSAFDALATPEGVQLMSMFGAISSPHLRSQVVELVRTLSAEDAS